MPVRNYPRSCTACKSALVISRIANYDFKPLFRSPTISDIEQASMHDHCAGVGPMRNNDSRYTTVAITLHWTIAALILLNISIGLVMEGLAEPLKAVAVPFHFSCGMTVLLLSALRLVWRLTHAPPPLPASMAPWERVAARTAHATLYLLMIAMPLVGWMIISAHPPRAQGAATLWGFLQLPAIAPIAHLGDASQKTAHSLFVDVHATGGWILIGLLVLHVAGALKHQWFDRRPELARMGIGRNAP
jgi:cytochrome b561